MISTLVKTPLTITIPDQNAEKRQEDMMKNFKRDFMKDRTRQGAHKCERESCDKLVSANKRFCAVCFPIVEAEVKAQS